MRSTGTLMCIASAAAFGAMAVFGKLAYGEGVSVGTLLAARFVLARESGLFGMDEVLGLTSADTKTIQP